MHFRKYISLFLSVSIFFQTIMPVIAMDLVEKDLKKSSSMSHFSLNTSKAGSSSSGLSPKRLISSIQELEENLPFLNQYKSTPAPLTFWGEPGKTAAGILHFAEHEGEIYFFLGERNDDKNSWCNLGGGSDTREDGPEEQGESSSQQKSDILTSALGESLTQKLATTLDDDGARESEEESNGIYTLHRRLLKKCPFIDTYDPNKKMYYRMYWQRVMYIDSEVFLNKLQDAEHEHNKEYTNYKWFKAKDLLDVLLIPDHPLRQNIYEPLLNTLSTDSTIAFMQELCTSKKLNRYKSHIRPLCNRLYIIGNTATDHDTTPVKWPLLNVDGQHELLGDQVRGEKNFLNSEQELKQFRSTYFSLSTKELPQALYQLTFQPNSHQVIPVASLIEQDQLDEAVAAHGMAMVLAKSRFKREGLLPLPQILPVMTPEWDPYCTETLSRIHLRIVLGRDYKEECNFQTQLKPQQAADIANMRLYFSRYKKAETCNKQAEFKREITPQDSDYEFLADILEWETQGRIWPTSFHGASSKANSLIKAFTYQKQLFDIEDYNGTIFLRGTDIYFNGIQNMRNLIEKEGVDESDRSRAAMLFMNFVLFAGLQTTRSTSSSVEYVLNDHSVNEVDVDDRYEEAGALAGFHNPSYGPFKSIHEQFKGNKDRNRGNSVLLAICQFPGNFDDYNYPTGGGGDFWNPDHISNLTEMPSSAKILKGIQTEYERQRMLDEPEAFEVDTERKRALFPENRGYLEPRRMKDNTQFYIKSFDRFKLTEEETQKYNHQMIATTIATGADWLSGRSQILDGSFAAEPNLKKLHKFVVKGVTGDSLKETFSPAGFIHLVRNGQLEGVKQFLMCFPKVLEYEGLTPQKLLESAIESQNADLIQYLAEDVLKSDVKTILGLENFYARMRMLLYETNPVTLRFLLSQFDPRIIPDDVKLLWLNFTHGTQMKLAILQYILDTSPHLSKDALENILSQSYMPEEAYKVLIDEGTITAQELLIMVHDRLLKGAAREYHTTVIPVKFCLEKGADLMALHPTTEEPMVFLLPEMMNYLPSEITSWLQTRVDIWKFVDKQGLTLLQVVQKNLLEGRRDNGLFHALTQMCKAAQLDYKDQSYQPFFDYFGPLGPSVSFPFNSHYILRAPESIEWASNLQSASDLQQAEALVASCPHHELIWCFEGKISSFGLHDSYRKTTELDKERTQWITNVKLALSDKDRLNGLLMTAPSANLRCVLYLILEDKYVDILPSVLQRLYPTKKAFIEEYQIRVDTSEYHAHPALYALQQKGHNGVTQCFLNFLGYENLPQFIVNFPSYRRSLLDGILSDNDLHKLYEAIPSLFTGVSLNGEDMFTESLINDKIPLSLKRKIIKDNSSQLKTLEMRHSGIPYFWSLLFSGEQSIPLIKELVDKDPSLLHLKSLEGLTLQRLLAVFPKGHAHVRFLKRLLTSGNADITPEVLPNHVVVHSFREILEQLGDQRVHLWSDIDEVMIFDKHFWRYDSFRELIPFELQAHLGEYDHALLDEEAPSIFKTILQNKGRINGLTARPAEEQKFESTHRRLIQSGFTFSGTQGMESVFTKEKFPHCDRDTFFCGNKDKGEIVLEAIEALYGETKAKDLPLFVFPDDLMDNLIAVSESLKNTRYKFMLCHFRAIDRKLAPYAGNQEALLAAIKVFLS